MNRQLDIWMLLILGCLMAAGVVGIGLFLPVEEGPKATYLIELGKILATGIIVGILGVWAKQVFERATEYKHELAVRTAARKELFEALQLGAREALQLLRDPKYDAARAFDVLFGGRTVDFEGLLEKWKAIEPDTASAVLSSFHGLEAAFYKQGLSQEFRDRAQPEIIGWSKQFASRALGVT